MMSPFYPKNAAARALFCVLMFFSGCAYFNTFYNAQQYFDNAEKVRLQQQGQALPKGAIDAYELAIEKSAKVLEQYPESRFRKPALLLMAESHFHLMQYKRAQVIFLQLKDQSTGRANDELDYWLSLCKWRQGKPQPALIELTALNEKSKDSKLKARIAFSIADIYLETANSKIALEFLEQGAKLTRDSNERAEIYYRIAILALEAGDYDRALEANRNVIRNSLTKARIEEANLNIVKIHRELEDWESVSGLIKKLLSDETYRGIWGNLELELAKLHKAQGKYDQALIRLETVGTDYSRTESSAEAYFIMGEMALDLNHDFETALKHFVQVPREFASTPFKGPAKKKEKEITAFQAAREEITRIRQQISDALAPVDSALIDSTQIAEKPDVSELQKSLSKSLYEAGELWAFHFGVPDSALGYFYEVTDSLPESDLNVKALFSVSYLLEHAGNRIEADKHRRKILDEYPKSEYADHIRKFLDMKAEINPSHTMLIESEQQIKDHPEEAFTLYRRILKQDTTSEYSAMAAYSMAYHYDSKFHEADSALKYYGWLQDHHPYSDQFKAARARMLHLERLVISMDPDTLSKE